MATTTRRAPSLVLRLTVSIGTAISLLLLGIGWLVERSINDHFVHQDITELSVARDAIASVVLESPRGGLAQSLRQRFGGASAGHRSVDFLLVDRDGAVLFATAGVNLAPLLSSGQPAVTINQASIRLWKAEDRSYRVAVIRLVGSGNTSVDPYTLVLATDIDFHLHYLESFHRYLRWLTFVACLIAVAAIAFAVYRGHAPIRRISRRISQINAQELHIRLDERTIPRELVPLVQAFNAMVIRLEEGFGRLSNFSVDIAHELRTPITNLTTQTQVALSKARSADQYLEILYSNLEEYERMTKMVNDMLLLAKSDNHLLVLDQVEVSLADEIRSLFEFFEAWADELGIRLEFDGASQSVRGDRLMLRRALTNLLSNAIRHTPAGMSTEVHINREGDWVRVNVSNPGTPIAPEHLDRLFDRFYRPDSSQRRSADGAGLGLALVLSIVKAHHGTVKVQSDESLTTFSVLLPRA